MPWGLDIDSDRHLAYVTNRGNYYITVVDIIAKEVVTKIPIAGRAESISVDPSEHKIYAGFTDQQNIIKIDGNTNQIENIIEMEGVPIDLVASPTTHDIYASIKFQDKVIVIGPRAISASLPVVKIDTPTAIIGTIKVHGYDTAVSEPYIDTSNRTLIMNVQSLDGGNLNLNIPRMVLDSQKNGTDSPFTVLLNGKDLKYQEMTKNPDYRELAVFIPKGSQLIKIIGTTVPVGAEIVRTR
jgi:DNA-binding beta-propeller fold protein YncE